MMNEYPNTIKKKLTHIIENMSASISQFVKNPGKDFTRTRKLPFETVMHLLISIGGNSLYKELLESHGYNADTATTSAFVQQRDKILPTALEFLFHEFTHSFTDIKKYRDYRLLAVDGSALNVDIGTNDSDTFIQNGENTKGFHLLHLNAMYDLCSQLYIDAVIQPRRKLNEKRSLCDMVDRSEIEGNVIVFGDRGFEGYNNFAHIENKGWNYIIRVKDIDSKGIVAPLPLPDDDEFDVCFNRILTKKHTREIKSHPEIYRFIPSKTTFDYINSEDIFYPISLRIVRVKTDEGSYITLITNLKKVDFPPEDMKILYNLRWGIETSFRALKYTVGLANFHTKKRDCIIQEIFARMIMYNFTQMIASHVVVSKATDMHAYQVNFTVAVLVCRQFLRSKKPLLDVEVLIGKNCLPVRAGRKFTRRKINGRALFSFNYRIA